MNARVLSVTFNSVDCGGESGSMGGGVESAPFLPGGVTAPPISNTGGGFV